MSERSRSVLARVAYLYRVLAEGVNVALDSLRASIFRSGLTILGVGIGVAVVVLMAALITGIRTSVQEGIESSGPRNLFITRFDPTAISFDLENGPQEIRSGPRPNMTSDEAARLTELPAVREAIRSVGLGGLTVELGTTRISGVSASAESESWPEYRAVEFVQGRNFVESEVTDAAAVVVISEQLALDLFGSEEAVGQRLRAAGGTGGAALPLTVVGVVHSEPSLFEEAGAHFAVVPYTTAVRRMGARESSGQMIVVPEPIVSLDEVEDQIIGLLRGLRGLGPDEENNFAVTRSTQILAVFDRFTAVFFFVMLALSSVGLLVGGVGVIGIMMISVTERTREIGIRKALGATKAEILWQFLVEASVLTVLGGAAGLILGGGLTWLLATFSPIPASVPAWAVAVSLVMAALTGMVFGLVPAMRGARMEPVEALRHE